MTTFWWVLSNLLLPIFLPFLVLWPWRLAEGNARYDEKIRKNTSMGAAVKNGQFCLTTMAICGANLHEVLSVHGTLPDWLVATTSMQGVIGAFSLLVYTLAMVFDSDVDLSKSGKAWLHYYRFGVSSLVICGIVGVLAIANHIGIENIREGKLPPNGRPGAALLPSISP